MSKTERKNMAIIQDALGAIKAAAAEEIKAQMSEGNAELVNAWCHVDAGIRQYHADMTDLGLKHFPEFFAEVVTRGPGR